MSTLISIITVVYNGSKTIEQTINSVISQTYRNIEYIIIDGGSTDGTLDIIQKYKEHINQFVSEPDKGLYDAMNKGIAMAKGEIIGMINSDDWYEPNAVELIVQAYIKHPNKRIFHGDRFDITQDGSKKVRPFNSSTLKFLFYGMTYNHPSMFVHRDIYNETTYDIHLRALSDYEFVLTRYLKDRNDFCYIPSCYVNYRLDGISAKLPLSKALKEGFIARKRAKMSWINCVISVFVRFSISLIHGKRSLFRINIKNIIHHR